MLLFRKTLHPQTHMHRLHSLVLRVVLQARSLSAALRAGTGAEKRVATSLFAAGPVGPVGWCGSGPGGVVQWRAGWGGGVADRWGGGPGGVAGRLGPGGAVTGRVGRWGLGGAGGGLAGRVGVGRVGCWMRGGGYVRLYSPKGYV